MSGGRETSVAETVMKLFEAECRSDVFYREQMMMPVFMIRFSGEYFSLYEIAQDLLSDRAIRLASLA